MAHELKGRVGDTAETLSSTETAVAKLWCEVLQLEEPLNAGEDFFALGGDSMAMTTVEYLIEEEFSVSLTPGAMLGASTLRALSALIDTARTRDEPSKS